LYFSGIIYNAFGKDAAMIEKVWLEKFAKDTKKAGIVMMLIGGAGFLLPYLFSISLSYLLGWLLLFGAFTQGYSAYQHKDHHIASWLRPFLNTVAALIFLLFTNIGIASLGLLLAFYFFMDAYASFAMGQLFKEHGVSGWGIINGLLSFVLGLVVLATWPNSSPLLVGIFVGITLFFDGLLLLFLGKNISKL
jgi:uncharacterized membrane protein HdeD (DUF308 family)